MTKHCYLSLEEEARASHISLLQIVMRSETLMKQMTLVDCIQKINNRKI